MPLLALLVDLRHEAAYGSVFAIAQLAVCLAYSAGKFKLFNHNSSCSATCSDIATAIFETSNN